MDADNDGIIDLLDDFPLDPNESKDTDGDGIGDNADLDDNNDGFPEDPIINECGRGSDSNIRIRALNSQPAGRRVHMEDSKHRQIPDGQCEDL